MKYQEHMNDDGELARSLTELGQHGSHPDMLVRMMYVYRLLRCELVLNKKQMTNANGMRFIKPQCQAGGIFTNENLT